jgi:TolA-binding protein
MSELKNTILSSRHRRAILFGIGTAATLACAGHSDRETLADLRSHEPDLTEAPIDDGIDQAMAGYRQFLAETPKSSLTPEAMRRLADLKLEKEFGILGSPDISEKLAPNATPALSSELPRPEVVEVTSLASAASNSLQPEIPRTPPSQSQQEFEARTVQPLPTDDADLASRLTLPDGRSTSDQGPLEAIKLYDEILTAYPNYAQTDQVLYQKARAFDELGRVDEAIAVAETLINRFPNSRHIDEAQFRRAEYFFTRRQYFTSEEAYSAIVDHGPHSGYFELALYKLGWSFYKQMMLDETLDSYVTLLDHKIATGYDFDQAEDDTEEQRIADTYRVMSLCFSEQGGASAVTDFFGAQGKRSYEDRVYQHLGEFYLEKRRYNDAATAYETFVDLNPTHRNSPHFSMRIVEIYEAGDFPKLVLDAKKNFAESYGLNSAYWEVFDAEETPEVIEFLKGNLEDLANHFHALYQSTEKINDKPAHFAESTLWYREYLSSFPEDLETPGIHYQLADLLLENEDFVQAAAEYEHIAYDYPSHERSAAAGYAAIFANRQFEKTVEQAAYQAARRESIASTMRFVAAFPQHEHSAAVLGAATEDLYDLKDYLVAISTGRRLLDEYPVADDSIRRAAWTVIAHASFDTDELEVAEAAYAQVLSMTSPDDESVEKITNNLAATIYKQGELARDAEDYQKAADHFLRIAAAAPQSTIRPIAEYDAAAALIQLSDWMGAATVLESFRQAYPAHKLSHEATQQIAFVYREDGNLSRAAEEYERVSAEATESELRRESLLVAAELYDEAKLITKALSTYESYVTKFTEPIEPAVVARFKMADLFHKTDDEYSRRAQLEKIVAIDRAADETRTDGVRLYAARSALMLSEVSYTRFSEIELTLPFEKSLERKKTRMNSALATFGNLIDYEVGEVTAAATYYMAKVYGEFSRALLDSERPHDLAAGDLEEYEMVLEEEAFPFEEKSIDVHEKNLELMRTGIFNEWIEKSLAQLAVVMPGRYAKFDASPGLMQSISAYSYQSPRADLSDPTEFVTESPVEIVEASDDLQIQDVPLELAESPEDDASAEVIADEPNQASQVAPPASPMEENL